jgi:hypothetical protein
MNPTKNRMKNRKQEKCPQNEKSEAHPKKIGRKIGWALKRTNASAEKRALGLLA